MSAKFFITIGVIVGSTIGGYIPALWGGSAWGMAGIFGSFLGGLLGIYIGYWFYHNYME